MVAGALLLSRIQFGFTIGFHILFPTFNLGLALFIAVMEGLWLKTKNPEYLALCKFWTKIFALTFGMGVVSGIVLSYELGTNFSRFTEAAGGVLGSLFAYEAMSAFFLEAGFLGVMLFGWNKVSPKLHYLATCLVMLGTTISAFWIMAANSWMQSPAGYKIVQNKFVVTSWFHVIFNPTFLPRFVHMLFAAYVTTCFVIAGVSAWYLLKNKHEAIAKRAFSFVLGAALILVPTQIFIGDVVGLKIHQYQPIKTAAMEGIWKTQNAAPFVVVALPNQQEEKNNYALSIPYGASLINTHSLQGNMVGLDSVPPQDRPNVPVVFFTFRIMVGIGILFLGTALYGFYLRRRNTLFSHKNFYRFCILISPLGFVSTIAGWLTAEMGRQPWVIYGLMKTADASSPVPASNVAISLVVFIIVYGFVFSFYLFYLFKLISQGPNTPTETPTPFLYLPKDPKKQKEIT